MDTAFTYFLWMSIGNQVFCVAMYVVFLVEALYNILVEIVS